MEILLLGIYSFFAWLVFFKFKWLPWNITTQVITDHDPDHRASRSLILFLNIDAPSSPDVRVMNYVVPINPRVAGKVIEVPVEPNSPIKKGDVLFKLDPVPFQIQVQLAEAKVTQLRAQAGLGQGQRPQPGRAAQAGVEPAGRRDHASSTLAQQARRAVPGTGEDRGRQSVRLEQAQADVANLEDDLPGRAGRAWRRPSENLAAKTPAGVQQEVAQVLAQIAQAEAQLADAQWQLGQTVLVRAGRRHGGRPRAAPGRDGGAVPGVSGDDLHRGRAVDRRVLRPERGAQDRSPATRRRSRSRRTRAASSSARWTRSSGPPHRASCRSAACCRTRGFGAGARTCARGEAAIPTARTRGCSSPPARAATARSTPTAARRSTSCARCSCASAPSSTGWSSSCTDGHHGLPEPRHRRDLHRRRWPRCAVKPPPAPDEVRKDALQGTEVRATWAKADAAGADATPAAISDNWLATFDDPQLTALVNEAIARNPDLRAAGARVEQAAAYARLGAGPAAALVQPARHRRRQGRRRIRPVVGPERRSCSASRGSPISGVDCATGATRPTTRTHPRRRTSSSHGSRSPRRSPAAGSLAIETKLELDAAESMAASARSLVSLAEDRQRVGNGSDKDVAHGAGRARHDGRLRAAGPARPRAGRALARDDPGPLSGHGARGRNAIAPHARARAGRHAA